MLVIIWSNKYSLEIYNTLIYWILYSFERYKSKFNWNNEAESDENIRAKKEPGRLKAGKNIYLFVIVK